ncbi:MAG: hypothetical protein ABSE64_07365 [Vulcanimicrobiaceae bacterium]|jgi:hypothetical protein
MLGASGIDGVRPASLAIADCNSNGRANTDAEAEVETHLDRSGVHRFESEFESASCSKR